MQVADLVQRLDYANSPNFLGPDNFDSVPSHTNTLRRASESCGLVGAYFLRAEASRSTAIPVVFVCEAQSEASANQIHRRVWNQDTAPFLLVKTPSSLRVYSGFRYEKPQPGSKLQPGLIESNIGFEEVDQRLGLLSSRSIDDGTIWERWGSHVDPRTRVDQRLLRQLEQLGKLLQQQGLDAETTHALIGKFVYLRYLQDRQILSDRKFQEWNIDRSSALGRAATLGGFGRLIEHVDEWLNGSIFPLAMSGGSAPRLKHLRTVAGVFLGDEPETGQLHLDFQAYDFAQLPIETLSSIYEQFLAHENKQEEAGAFYTPVPVVNFMLDEMCDLRPIVPGMRALDPACGSGAFLVQCYRRLIEDQLRRKKAIRPTELRDILVGQIFGMDRDRDACRVTELSLVLTLLDYIQPPDLHGSRFKLPDLHNRNIFESDFFDRGSSWSERADDCGYDWIVGNPPWTTFKPSSSNGSSYANVAQWAESHSSTCPIALNDVSEAFAWKAAEHSKQGGAIGLLLPAMTLFKEQPTFRSSFFSAMQVSTIANLANLREVLFMGRSRAAAAAIFYSSRHAKGDDDNSVLVFSPLVINQEANRPGLVGARRKTWTLTIDASEVRQVRRADAATGLTLPWKTAMWGSPRDARLVIKLGRRFDKLAALVEQKVLTMSQGLELRAKGQTNDAVDPLPEVIGKRELKMKCLARLGRIYVFPQAAVHDTVKPERAFVRKRGGRGPLRVCQPPHIIISETRAFAVYVDDFLVVPHPQIGIASSPGNERLLRALSLFVVSDIGYYHQFFASSRMGLTRDIATFRALKELPIPFTRLDDNRLEVWSTLHRALVEISEAGAAAGDLPFSTAGATRRDVRSQVELEDELNRLAFEAMNVGRAERALVRDLVRVRRHLIDGRVTAEADRSPTLKELDLYATLLRDELDDFLEDENARHRVNVACDGRAGQVRVELETGRRCIPVRVHAGDGAATFLPALSELIENTPQWRYFSRNLHLRDGDVSYVVKPAQRLWWLESQALADADDMISEQINSRE